MKIVGVTLNFKDTLVNEGFRFFIGEKSQFFAA